MYLKVIEPAPIKTQTSNLGRMTRFWNNHHPLSSKTKDWKAKQFIGRNNNKGPKRDGQKWISKCPSKRCLSSVFVFITYFIEITPNLHV